MGNEDQALTVYTKKNIRDYHHPKVSTHTRITLEDIYLVSDSIHVMRKDTSPESVPETKVALKRRRTRKQDIMLMLQRMMNLPRRESNKKVKILQVMKSMFLFLPSWELSHMGAMIGLSIVVLPNI